MSDDPYRRNPARDIEKLAVEVVQRWVGAGGQVTDTSSGHLPDFRIDYRDGRTGIGEVGWHEDPVVRAMWGNTFKRDQHQTVPLREGLGRWWLQLGRGANIKRLHRDVPALVETLAVEQKYKLDVLPHWPQGDVGNTARRLGIEHIERADDDADEVIYFMPPSEGFVVPADPDAIVDWIEVVLADPDYADTTRKLLDVEADERHVFLMTGSATPSGIQTLLWRVDTAPPTRPPRLAEGITHIWAAPQFGADPCYALGWSDVDGWSTTLLPLPSS